MSAERLDASLLVLLAIVALLVPFVLSGYEIKLATTITIQAGFAVALGFVVGPAGLISIGHAAFYGLAAYLFAIVAPQTEPANLITTALIAIFGAAALAALVGAVSIRSRGLYFILMTLAFGQLGYHFFHDTGIGGSPDGTYIYFRPELRLPGVDIGFDNAAHFYWLVSLVVFLVIGLVWWLRRSAFGSILIAARDNETRTRAFGYSPYAIRLVAFVVSGAMAGAMGYLTAAQHGYVAPQMLAWHNSATALVMVLIGGKDTTSGPAIGAILLLLAEEVLQRASEHWLVGVGLIIVAVVIAAPNGLVPYLASVMRGKRVRHA
jgi:branched-chain amino acid transport system permease protein